MSLNLTSLFLQFLSEKVITFLQRYLLLTLICLNHLILNIFETINLSQDVVEYFYSLSPLRYNFISKLFIYIYRYSSKNNLVFSKTLSWVTIDLLICWSDFFDYFLFPNLIRSILLRDNLIDFFDSLCLYSSVHAITKSFIETLKATIFFGLLPRWRVWLICWWIQALKS